MVLQVQTTAADGTVPPSCSLVSNAPFTKLTDGTNTANTMDVAARAGYQYVTDGTNTMPTMDVAARKGFVLVTDGTNSMPTADVNTRALWTHLTDGTSDLTLGTGTTKTLPCELNDGTTKIVFGTGTTKNVPVGFNDGTTAITFGTGTVKTVPVGISDGTTEVDVIATINSIKSDVSSVAGTATNVNGGNRDAGTQTVTLADDDPLVTSNAIPTTLTGGSLAVTATGTAEVLGASLATKSIYIRAKSTNTGNVYVGDSSVDATTSQQIILAANDSVTIPIANRATVYVDCAVNGEGVDYLASS